ncbi:MAG TPA: hypothetical protein VF718_02595 [Allosphingosinicella sp.]
MIVVVGSRHDPVAAALVREWPDSALCRAEDITAPGWLCRNDHGPLRWVVEGQAVQDDEVTGIFVRRCAFYPEEFLSTHREDRVFLAAEAQAFLGFVLSRTRATVANPPRDGALGGEGLGFEHWMPAAVREGLPIRPFRLAGGRRRLARPERPPLAVEVVGDEAFGDAPAGLKDAATRLARALGLVWAAFLFDGRRRLMALTVAAEPGPQARRALGNLLARRREA